MKTFFLLMLLLLGAPLLALDDAAIREAYHNSYAYERVENYDDAIRSMLPVLRDYPETYTVNLRLGWLYYLNKKYANALEHYEKAIKIAPASIEAKLGHLLPLLAQARYAEVEREAFQILNVDFYNYYGNMRLIYALRMLHKYEAAEKVVLKMLAIYPIDVIFLTEYALIRHGQGDTDTAVKVFYDVQILDPENPTAKDFLKPQKPPLMPNGRP